MRWILKRKQKDALLTKLQTALGGRQFSAIQEPTCWTRSRSSSDFYGGSFFNCKDLSTALVLNCMLRYFHDFNLELGKLKFQFRFCFFLPCHSDENSKKHGCVVVPALFSDALYQYKTWNTYQCFHLFRIFFDPKSVSNKSMIHAYIFSSDGQIDHEYEKIQERKCASV